MFQRMLKVKNESLFSENWHLRALISNGPKNFFSPMANLKEDVFAVILSRAVKLT